MKQSTQIPPVYDKCRDMFGVRWARGIIITYGDTVHCKNELQPHKLAHEAIHVRQQTADMNKDVWWDRYFLEPDFRLRQEVEAYQAEAKWIKANVRDRNRRYFLVREIWNDLSSSIYGNVCTLGEAMSYIPYSR